MFNLRKFKPLLLVAIAAALCVGQSASEYDSKTVVQIAGKMKCNCGCKLSMACVMPPTGVCPVCKESKIRIASMVASGMTEKQILDAFVKEQGQDVLIVTPGIMGFVGPYIALGVGLAGVLFALSRMKKNKPVPVVAPANDAEFARYHDQIEKDLDKLD